MVLLAYVRNDRGAIEYKYKKSDIAEKISFRFAELKRMDFMKLIREAIKES